MRTPEVVQQELKLERRDLAFAESEYHRIKTEEFIANRAAKTVKEMEYLSDYGALNFHADLQLMRAKVRSLEDELRVALHGTG